MQARHPTVDTDPLFFWSHWARTASLFAAAASVE
jgi:hypothetical protein